MLIRHTFFFSFIHFNKSVNGGKKNVAKNWQDRVMSHIQENSSLYIFNAVLLLMGVIFGAILVNSLQINQNKIYHFIYNVFGQVSKGEFAIAGEMFSEKVTFRN